MQLKVKATLFVFLILVFFSATSLSYGQGYNYRDLTDELKQMEKQHKDFFKLHSIGNSLDNKDIWLAEVTNFKNYKKDNPAVFVAGNIEADHTLGTNVILKVIKNMIEGYSTDADLKKIIDNKILYFAPRINPDGAELFFKKPYSPTTWNMRITDEDNDAFIDEDSAEDLNNDGFITLMRVKDPDGEYIIDEKEPRLLTKAVSNKGEAGIYKLYLEGNDNDNDGLYNEDKTGGVNINMNFPFEYPYYKTGAGRHMVSEPETKAILDFIYEHKNIFIILTYSHFDNIVTPPKPQRTTRGEEIDISKFYSPSGGFEIPEGEDRRTFYRRFFQRKPIKNYNRIDIPYFERISEKFKNITGIKSYILNEEIKPEGTLYQWGYFHFGSISLSTPLWIAEEKKEEPRRGQKEEPDYQHKLIKWIDENKPEAFLKWQPYKHEQLGDIEIGGFVPNIYTLASEVHVKDISDKQTEFIKYLASILPEVEIVNTEVNKKSDNLYELKVKLRNNGYLPTSLNHSIQISSIKPTLVKLKTDAEILSGYKILYLYKIDGSGKESEYSWLLKKNKDDKVIISLESEKGGSTSKTITLK